MSEQGKVRERYASPRFLAQYLMMEWGDKLLPKGPWEGPPDDKRMPVVPPRQGAVKPYGSSFNRALLQRSGGSDIGLEWPAATATHL
jgi:hypothetical protein